MPKNRELTDNERAHSGKPGAKVRHGADVIGKVSGGNKVNSFMDQGEPEDRGTKGKMSPNFIAKRPF